MKAKHDIRHGDDFRGLGHNLVGGSNEVTLSSQDSVLTVIAEPDLSAARDAFRIASERAASIVNSLDFSSEESAGSSLSAIMAIYDGARRTADLSLTRQYESESASLDVLESSYHGVMEKLTQELKLLEDELRLLEGEMANLAA